MMTARLRKSASVCALSLLDTKKMRVPSVMRPIQLNFATSYFTDSSPTACPVITDASGDTMVSPSGAATL